MMMDCESEGTNKNGHIILIIKRFIDTGNSVLKIAVCGFNLASDMTVCFFENWLDMFCKHFQC